MVRVYSEFELGDRWLAQYREQGAVFACVLGFTETGLIPGISAAGATPADRELTAIADAEFLYRGPRRHPRFPLPPLVAGVSPTLISRAVIEGLGLPVYLLDAGLRHAPTVPAIALNGEPASCVSTGNALPLEVVNRLWLAGLEWGEKLAASASNGYLILGECVVGGTTTALAVLTGLGWQAAGKVNSSHATCNHGQKWEIVQAGLAAAHLTNQVNNQKLPCNSSRPKQLAVDPLAVISAVGDPMQAVVAGMAIAASQTCGVLLAGGTQMLAVYALMQRFAEHNKLEWKPERVAVGTTRWVAEDPTGNTVGLAKMLSAPLLATQLSFANSRYEALCAYERGFVKEGVGAGGCAIAAHLQGWDNARLMQAVETLLEKRLQLENPDLEPAY